VNGGQLLQRWTNDYFPATPNRSGGYMGGWAKRHKRCD
jgi:hypothetical protein